MGRIIDISPLISPDIDVWPGDVPFTQEKSLEIHKGHNIDLGAMRTTYHVGAHADAPNHYHKDGEDIASVDLEPYYGPCQVVEVEVERGERIMPYHVKADIARARVLFKTGTFPDPNDWNDDFASLSPGLIQWLAGKDVVLVGIDTPSVDPQDSKGLESHQALYKHKVRNLEGLVLKDVRPGDYTLVALPLRIANADAGPLRAALVVE